MPNRNHFKLVNYLLQGYDIGRVSCYLGFNYDIIDYLVFTFIFLSLLSPDVGNIKFPGCSARGGISRLSLSKLLLDGYFQLFLANQKPCFMGGWLAFVSERRAYF